jgi:hypothetical protein
MLVGEMLIWAVLMGGTSVREGAHGSCVGVRGHVLQGVPVVQEGPPRERVPPPVRDAQQAPAGAAEVRAGIIIVIIIIIMITHLNHGYGNCRAAAPVVIMFQGLVQKAS